MHYHEQTNVDYYNGDIAHFCVDDTTYFDGTFNPKRPRILGKWYRPAAFALITSGVQTLFVACRFSVISHNIVKFDFIAYVGNNYQESKDLTELDSVPAMVCLELSYADGEALKKLLTKISKLDMAECAGEINDLVHALPISFGARHAQHPLASLLTHFTAQLNDNGPIDGLVVKHWATFPYQY